MEPKLQKRLEELALRASSEQPVDFEALERELASLHFNETYQSLSIRTKPIDYRGRRETIHETENLSLNIAAYVKSLDQAAKMDAREEMIVDHIREEGLDVLLGMVGDACPNLFEMVATKGRQILARRAEMQAAARAHGIDSDQYRIADLNGPTAEEQAELEFFLSKLLDAAGPFAIQLRINLRDLLV